MLSRRFDNLPEDGNVLDQILTQEIDIVSSRLFHGFIANTISARSGFRLKILSLDAFAMSSSSVAQPDALGLGRQLRDLSRSI